ncbi:MAG: copper-binding protein [Oceanospirillaceae bacterium]|nr:copper-binding protein [Oceanospirillaceae bacterium]
MSEWEWLTVVTRWWLYIGMSAAIGGMASYWLAARLPEIHRTLRRYALLGGIIGLTGTGTHFLVRVGAFAEQGLAGMFDPFMLQILWQSPVGDALWERALGFGLIFVALLPAPVPGRHLLEIAFSLLGSLLIGLSFSSAGHALTLESWAAALLVGHVIVAAWWMGSLVPLWLAMRRLTTAQLRTLMVRFGEIAVVAVLLLLAAGGLLVYQLTGWQNLLGTDYGLWLLIKLALVGLILGLAAYHKLRLVPSLAGENCRGHELKRSLILEKMIGGAILAITTVLTTLVGPVH